MSGADANSPPPPSHLGPACAPVRLASRSIGARAIHAVRAGPLRSLRASATVREWTLFRVVAADVMSEGEDAFVGGGDPISEEAVVVEGTDVGDELVDGGVPMAAPAVGISPAGGFDAGAEKAAAEEETVAGAGDVAAGDPTEGEYVDQTNASAVAPLDDIGAPPATAAPAPGVSDAYREWQEANRSALAERTAEESVRKDQLRQEAQERLASMAEERARVLAQRHENNLRDNEVADDTLASSIGATGREWACIVDVWTQNFTVNTRRDQSRMREVIIRRRDKERKETAQAAAAF